jgi:hypothetical protein
VDNITNASELLQVGQSALVLFTDGNQLVLQPDGTGSTGNWRLDDDFECDKVIIYWRTDTANKVHLGDFIATRSSPERNRRVVVFRNMSLLGVTDSNWFQFANGSQLPNQVIEKV